MGDLCLQRLLREEGAVAYPDTFPATACLPGLVDKETTQGHDQGHLWDCAFRSCTIDDLRQVARHLVTWSTEYGMVFDQRFETRLRSCM